MSHFLLTSNQNGAVVMILVHTNFQFSVKAIG